MITMKQIRIRIFFFRVLFFLKFFLEIQQAVVFLVILDEYLEQSLYIQKFFLIIKKACHSPIRSFSAFVATAKGQKISNVERQTKLLR